MVHGSKNSEKSNFKETEPKRNVTRMVEHTDNKKPIHSKTNQNHNSCWSPCLPLLIFPLISEVSQQLYSYKCFYVKFYRVNTLININEINYFYINLIM